MCVCSVLRFQISDLSVTFFMYFGGSNTYMTPGALPDLFTIVIVNLLSDYVNPQIRLKSADSHVTPSAWSFKNIALKCGGI